MSETLDDLRPSVRYSVFEEDAARVKVFEEELRTVRVKVPGIPGGDGLSAFEKWRQDRGDPDLTEKDFYSYIASLANPGEAQRSYQIVNVSNFVASHVFPNRPNVTLLTTDGEQVETDTYYSDGQVRLVFPAPFTGVLYLG